MFRIGVMGCGVVADYGHIPAILSTPELELVAVYDPGLGRAEATAAKFGIESWHTDQDEFLRSSLDAVIVCSTATAHPENVIAAAERGMHILCEKPLALQDSDAELMIAAAKRAQRLLLVGFVYRFSPVSQQLKAWVDEGIVGEIRSVRLVYDWDLHGRYEHLADGTWVESPRWRGRMLEGGPMIDCGVHMIDLARWWLGSEIRSIHCSGAWVTDYAAPDHMYLHLDHQGGQHTMVEMSFTYGHTSKFPAPIFTYDLIGTGGVLRYDRAGWTLEARNGEKHLVAAGASEKDFHGMYRHFVECLRSAEPLDFPTGEDGLIATQIARKATDQAIAGRVNPPG